MKLGFPPLPLSRWFGTELVKLSPADYDTLYREGRGWGGVVSALFCTRPISSLRGPPF